MFKKPLATALALCCILYAATGCSGSKKESKPQGSAESAATTVPETTVAVTTNLPKTDMTKWKYLDEQKIYYQLGISYCETPADEIHEKLAVFVPAAYFDATDNGDGTYTCSTAASANVNGYTAATAPIVFPVITPGYYDAEAMTEDDLGMFLNAFDPIPTFTDQGFVYVFAGCRGLNEGAPTGVTDLKAAVRYLRYCDDVIPGDSERIFAFGSSGGGAQAAILGASGDSELYRPYLDKIGAVQGVSDAICGSMDWCPIMSLDTADMEYEWMMGASRPERPEFETSLSNALANAYAEYVNSAGFKDKDGNSLLLETSSQGIYQAGSYYDYIKSVIETSLDHYLSDSGFTPDEAQAYIDGLNEEKNWVTYDKNTNTATITSVADFSIKCKPASDLIVAFDQPQSQNNLFGTGDGKPSHYDAKLAQILTEQNSEYAAAYNADLAKTDAVGNNTIKRVEMYSPLYYLMDTREGFGTSAVAKYWRIRSGIAQTLTSITTEVNLALALEHCPGVEGVDFETVWDQDHSEAERTGDNGENFIEWVKSCTA